MKTCSNCKEKLPDEKFRLRKGKKSNHGHYLNNTCRVCEAKSTREYYTSKKDDNKFREKNASRVSYYNKKTGYNKIRYQKNKIDPQWIYYMETWKSNNNDRVKEMQKKRSKKWHEKHMLELSDSYLKSKIKQQLGVNTVPNELIEIKRLQIKILREIR